MKRETFVSLLLGAVGVLLFGFGMCLCLLPEWDTFRPGVVLGVIGLLVLLILVIVRRKRSGKAPVRLSAKAVGGILLAVAGALLLGVGMCLCMVWEGTMLYGILLGLLGILALLCLIPYCKGLK